MADAQTLTVYAARAGDYSDRFASPRPDPRLAAFIAALPPGARVLDLGCGPGAAASFMRDAGMQVDAWDASPAMAQIARDRHGIEVTLAEFTDLSATATYDGIYANFSLLHAPKSEMPDHLLRIARALRPGGLFHIGLKTGEGEARDALGRFYAFYGEAELTGLLETAGLAVQDRATGAEAGLDGAISPWIIIRARKT